MHRIFFQTGRRRLPPPGRDAAVRRSLNLGLILPHSIYNEREYNKAVAQTIGELQRAKKPELRFLKKFHFAQAQVHRVMMKVNPSPTGGDWRTVSSYITGWLAKHRKAAAVSCSQVRDWGCSGKSIR